MNFDEEWLVNHVRVALQNKNQSKVQTKYTLQNRHTHTGYRHWICLKVKLTHEEQGEDEERKKSKINTTSSE